jgi:hypothetical protein
LKKTIYYVIFVIIALLSGSKSFAQKKDSTWTGTVNGIVWDSAHNTVLRAATVAVYTAGDADLISYRLTNNFGEFSLKGLPVDIPLKLVASFVGYKSYEKKFLITSLKNELDIGHANLPVSSSELKEVIISSTPPPIRMKGDTLEFSADAFKLDPNAQTEDLLRVLPGITVWADGTITVNGREVSSVLVNGKPFFGGDTRVASQNIPKNVVDKIQVYQKNKNPENPTDSTTEINIRLKKGKDFGYFGKFSGGYGTNNRYESDGSLNIFNNRSQLGIAFSGNNVNKVANDINFILRNTTFKGTGANVEYQSDFNIQGLNKYTAGGLIFQHDFISNPNYENNNRLTAQYFIKHNNQDLQQNTQTITTINDTNYYKLLNVSNSTNIQQIQNASANYEKLENGNKFSIDGTFKNESDHNSIENKSSIIDQNNNLLSTNNIFNKVTSNLNNVSITTAYQHRPTSPYHLWRSNYNINYRLNLVDSKDDQAYQSAYAVAGSPAEKVDVDRLYNSSATKLLHNLTFKLPSFGTLIFGNYKFAGIETGLQNELEVFTDKERNNVKDRDTLAKEYRNNAYLTNNRHETVLNVKPALTFTKTVYKRLSNRYEKVFITEADMGLQFYNLNSTSEKAFQQLSKPYQKFIPKANITYSNRQFGEFTNSATLQIAATSQYPTVQQLAPLADSANMNFIQIGNPSLKEQDTRELTINFRHLSERMSNILTWSVSLNAGYANNYFASSSSIDSLRRTIYMTVNADGYKYIGGSADIKKAYKLSNSQVQFSFSPIVSINRTPGYINGSLNYFNNFSLTCNPAINYTYKNWLVVNAIQRQNYNHYNQKGSDAMKLTNTVSQSELSFSINCTKKLTVNSNGIYTRNIYNGALVKTFTIWNATASYKLFKANTAEIKVSALDLLHQNTGLINYGFNNSITQGSVNALRQYFMLTLAYFPRKFGK